MIKQPCGRAIIICFAHVKPLQSIAQGERAETTEGSIQEVFDIESLLSFETKYHIVGSYAAENENLGSRQEKKESFQGRHH